MEFQVKDPKPLVKNTLRGFFTLIVGPLEIEGLSYHAKGEKSWVSLPSRPYQDKETGETKYSPIIRIPDENRYWRFQAWASKEAAALFKTIEPEPAPLPVPLEEADDDIPF